MHPLVREMQHRSGDADYLRGLLRRLVKAPVDREHSVILDNLHRFGNQRSLVASRLGSYLLLHLRSRRRNLHCWRAFRTLVKIATPHPAATAAAHIFRGHWYLPLRQSARDYLDLAASCPDPDTGAI